MNLCEIIKKNKLHVRWQLFLVGFVNLSTVCTKLDLLKYKTAVVDKNVQRSQD